MAMCACTKTSTRIVSRGKMPMDPYLTAFVFSTIAMSKIA